jgi:molybdate transport system substrate-binding protein
MTQGKPLSRRDRNVLLALLIVLLAIPCVIFVFVVPLTSPPEPPRTLTVFAAASLGDAFNEIATLFGEASPGVQLTFNFGASSQLAAQISEGAPADVFASANVRQYEVVAEAMAGERRIFAQNRLIAAMPAANPAAIQSLSDLARPGVRVVFAAPGVPARDYTDAMLNLMASSAEYGTAYREAVLANLVSEEDNVRRVVLRLSLGEADAGIVYSSDITPDQAGRLVTLAIPDEFNTLAEYPIGVTKSGAANPLSASFVDFVLSEAGQQVLQRWGFLPMAATP